jgi:hypothetical protein
MCRKAGETRPPKRTSERRTYPYIGSSGQPLTSASRHFFLIPRRAGRSTFQSLPVYDEKPAELVRREF